MQCGLSVCVLDGRYDDDSVTMESVKDMAVVCGKGGVKYVALGGAGHGTVTGGGGSVTAPVVASLVPRRPSWVTA